MEKTHRADPNQLPSRRKGRGSGPTPFPLALATLVLAMGAIVRVSALPVEARTQETWYACSQQMSYDFTARVVPGLIYPTGITASYRVDAVLSAPGYWQKSLVLLAPQEMTVMGDEVDLSTLAVEVPLRQILTDMEKLSQEQKLNYGQLELRVRPTVRVTTGGQREPVKAQLQPEFLLFFRDREMALEVEEPRTVRDEQSFTVTTVAPMTVQIFGRPVKVSTLRVVSTAALGGFALTIVLLGLLRWLWRRSMTSDDLRHLGATLITPSHWSIHPMR